MFDSGSVAVIESPPSLKALHKDDSYGWSEFRPIFPLLRPRWMDPEIDPTLLPRESFQMAYQRRAAFLAFPEQKDQDMTSQSVNVFQRCVRMARGLGESVRRPASIEKLHEWH